MYVIQRIKDGAYVNRPGSMSSYTRQLELARTFPCREEAQKEACGNELVVSVHDLLARFRDV